MPGTITAFASMSFLNSAGAPAQLQVAATKYLTAGDHSELTVFTVPTNAGGTAIPQGGVSTHGGWFMFLNTDPANYVDILSAVSGTPMLRLYPGEFAIGRFNPGITAPAALANTAPIELSLLILDN